MEAESTPSKPVNRLLWMAAAAGAEAAVKLHIARGDYLEWRDKRGLTPLMVAASRDRAGVCRLLLDAGVNASSLDSTGRDALSIARDAGALAAAEVIAACLPRKPIETSSVDLAPAQIHTLEDPVAEPLSPCSDIASTGEVLGKMPEPPTADVDNVTPPAAAEPCEPALPDMPPQPQQDTARDLDARHVHALEEHAHVDVIEAVQSADAVAAGLDQSPIEATKTPETPRDISGEPSESIFGDWEPVELTQAPIDVPSLAVAEGLRQRRIDEHAPIDDSADWTDFEAELPEFARPLPRANQAEFQAALRSVLLLALREGSVPRVAIEDLLSERGDAALRDIDAEEQLLVVIGDLGAEVDERSELPVGGDNFKVFVEPTESVAEERDVEAALAFFDALRSGRNDPLRIYMRSIGAKALLSAEREAALAKAMEAAVERALDALSAWPAGISALIDSVAGAESSPAILWPIVATAREESGIEGGTTDEVAPAATSPSAIEAEEETPSFVAEPTASMGDALQAFARIRELADLPAASLGKAAGIRQQLGTLSFRRPYLASFADRIHGGQGAGATAYRQAISDLIASRDEMTRANLRLVYSNAKRYLNSGMPLDDLMQEGNIGLIKAVDRFDWRRGFRFSTMATWWIKQQITRSIADLGFDIRLPVHVHEKMWKLRSSSEAFERSNGRSPSAAECASMLGVPIQKLEAFSRPFSEPLSIEEAEAMGAFELDAPANPMDIVSEKEVAQLISLRLSTFKRKVENIMRMRTGIGLNESQTLEQVGVAIGLTRERVRQIEAKAMKTLSSVRSREHLALDTGRELPKKAEASLYDLPEESDESEDEPPERSEGAERAKPSTKSTGKPVVRDVEFSGDPARPDALPSSIRRILDSARALGIAVDVQADGSRARILVAEIPSMDRDSRKLVRDMLQMGFVREQGKGYRR